MDAPDILTIGKQSVKSVFAVASRTLFLQIISFGTFLVVSTILNPFEIGIFTAVIAMQRIISFFTDFGLGAALIQKKESLNDDDLATSFTIQAGITLVIFIAVFLGSGILAKFMNLNPQGEKLLVALVFTIFISSFKTIPSIILERKIQFQKLVIPQIAEAIVFNGLLVFLVINKFGVDSYTYAFLASSIVGLPFYYFVAPWKIRLGINKNSLLHLKFGITFQAKNILATVKDDLLTVILAKFLDFTKIGYIGFAQRIAFFVYRYIVDSVTRVTFSSFSRIQDNLSVLRKAIEKSLFFVSSVMFPILMGIILIIPYFIEYFPKWSNKWEPAIISVIFFSLNAGISSMSGILVNILDATGRVNKTLKLMMIWTILTWTLTPLFIFYFGYNGVAAASFIVSVTIFYTIYLVRRVVDFSFLKSVYKPFLSSMVMGIIVFSLLKLMVTDMITLFIVILIGGISYVGLFYLIGAKEIREGIGLILKRNE